MTPFGHKDFCYRLNLDRSRAKFLRAFEKILSTFPFGSNVNKGRIMNYSLQPNRIIASVVASR